MTLPFLPDLTQPQDDLATVRERLLAVRASLQKACQDLDAQIQALDDLNLAHGHATPPAVTGLFESEPVPPVTVSSTTQGVWKDQPTTQIILKATGPATLDPELEQTTLEELNTALSKAFAQISGRHPWAG